MRWQAPPCRAAWVWIFILPIAHIAQCEDSEDLNVTRDLELVGNDTCQWPKCFKSCEPCPAKSVGNCVAKLIGANQNMCNTATTSCILGRCVCGDGYCAGQVTNEGLAVGDSSRLRSCVPQKCQEGARPPVYQPRGSTVVFASFALSNSFFYANRPLSGGTEFVKSTCVAAVFSLFLGFIVSACTAATLCLGHGCCAGRTGCTLQVFCCSRQVLECSDIVGEDEEPPLDVGEAGLDKMQLMDANTNVAIAARRLTVRRPPSILMVALLALVVCALCALSVVVRQRSWVSMYRMVTRELRFAKVDARALSLAGAKLNESISDIELALNGTKLDCAKSDPLLVMCTDQVTTALGRMIEEVQHFAAVAVRAPGFVEAVQEHVDASQLYGAFLPVVPQILLGFLVVVPLFFATVADLHRQWARCVDISMMSFFIVPFLAVLLVAVFTAVELAVAVPTAVMCMDIDDRALSIFAASGNEDCADIGRFYLKGDVANPLVKYIDDGVMYADQIASLYKEFEWALQLIGSSCKPFWSLSVPELTVQAKQLFMQAREMVGAGNVWPYYKTIVQDGLCDHILGDLGWVLATQLLLGYILFPLMVLTIHNYLVRLAKWEQDFEELNAIGKQMDECETGTCESE